jgi:hypothetical protein
LKASIVIDQNVPEYIEQERQMSGGSSDDNSGMHCVMAKQLARRMASAESWLSGLRMERHPLARARRKDRNLFTGKRPEQADPQVYDTDARWSLWMLSQRLTKLSLESTEKIPADL